MVSTKLINLKNLNCKTLEMNLVIVDFDGVLYRTDEMKRQLEKQLESCGIDSSTFRKVYDTVKQLYGYFDPEELYRQLDAHHQGWGEAARGVINSFPYNEFVDPHAIEAIQLMETLATVVILSQGDMDTEITNGNIDGYQARKILACLLPADRIIVRKDKIPFLEELYREYRPERLVVIDDDPNVLNRAPDVAVKIRIGSNTERNSFETIFEAAMYIHNMLKQRF